MNYNLDGVIMIFQLTRCERDNDITPQKQQEKKKLWCLYCSVVFAIDLLIFRRTFDEKRKRDGEALWCLVYGIAL